MVRVNFRATTTRFPISRAPDRYSLLTPTPFSGVSLLPFFLFFARNSRNLPRYCLELPANTVLTVLSG